MVSHPGCSKIMNVLQVKQIRVFRVCFDLTKLNFCKQFHKYSTYSLTQKEYVI